MTATLTERPDTAPLVTLDPIESGWERTVSNHIGVRQAIRHSLTMAHRGLIKIRRTPEQLFDVTFQPIVFTLMFTYVFGGAIAGDVKSYLPQFIPGILAMTVITTSMASGVQLREDMDKGVVDRFRSLPIARIAPLAGALIADTLRFLIATSLTFIVGICIGYRPGGGVLGVLLASLLVIVTAWGLSWIFVFFGVIARSATAVQGLSMMILFPLTFMSNAFVPTTSMPGWLQGFVNVNPVSHLVNATRGLANHCAGSMDVVWTLTGVAVVMAIFVPLAVKAYMRKA